MRKTLKCIDEEKPLPDALPDEVDPNIEERPLTPSQVAWFMGEMGRIDAGRLVNCGVEAACDGYARRCWICRPGQPDYSFDEYNADEREQPDVFAFARAIYRLGTSVMRARFSLDCLVPHQPVLFRGLEARRPLFAPKEHYLREHYVFEMVE